MRRINCVFFCGSRLCSESDRGSEMNSNPEKGVIKFREYSFHLQWQEIYKQKSFLLLKILSVWNYSNGLNLGRNLTRLNLTFQRSLFVCLYFWLENWNYKHGNYFSLNFPPFCQDKVKIQTMTVTEFCLLHNSEVRNKNLDPVYVLCVRFL